ncbi:MAG: SIMPL domain-containing protein, partial [Deltaproteobacteria bacterium]|nr:SIMPL domain-containing protein [Deltaproteobacteria bacterium]
TARVRARLQAAQIPDANVQTSRVGLEQSWEYAGGSIRQFKGYVASVSYRVRVDQLDKVEPLLIDLVDAGVNHIDAVEFLSSSLRDLRQQARELAVHAAKSKADTYVKAAGARLGPVLHIEDVNPDMMTRGGHGPNLDLSAHSDEPAAALKPGSITIAAAVVVGFGLQPT